MPTGEKYFNATLKRVVSLEDMRDNVIDYLQTSDHESLKAIISGNLVVGSTKTAVSADGTDKLKLDSATKAIDDLGNILDTTDVHATYFEDLDFPNETGETYNIGLTYAKVPSGVQINGRTGLPEYDTWEDFIGVSGEPSLVTDNGTTITFDLDNVITESEDHSGRKVRVWKTAPAAGAISEAIAIEEVDVTWSGSNNQITTTGLLGQTTVDETEANYVVCLLGPYIDTDTKANDVVLGTIVGNGPGAPTGFDSSTQRLLDYPIEAVADIIRLEATSGLYKVSVDATAADEATNQIEVIDKTAAEVFGVDGSGNVDSAGKIECVQLDSIVSAGPYSILGLDSSSGGTGVNGNATSATGSGKGIYGQSGGATGRGVEGSASHESGSNYGVYGESGSSAGTAVYGLATVTGDVTTYGVQGKTYGDTGRGVYGEATDSTAGINYGVYGKTTSTSGHGVYGLATGNGINYGVKGVCSGTFGTGVLGDGVTGVEGIGSSTGVKGSTTVGKGVHGTSTSNEGVRGEATATGDYTNYGVYGLAKGQKGRGVYGEADETGNYTNYGVYGLAKGQTGRGVCGEADGTGVNENFGVYGTAAGGLGVGVYGEADKNGVKGECSSTTGEGVYGINTASSGNSAHGVYGVSESVTAGSAGVYGKSVLRAGGTGVRGEGAWLGGWFEGGTAGDIYLVGQASAPSSPYSGSIYLNTTQGELRIYIGSSWYKFDVTAV